MIVIFQCRDIMCRRRELVLASQLTDPTNIRLITGPAPILYYRYSIDAGTEDEKTEVASTVTDSSNHIQALREMLAFPTSTQPDTPTIGEQLYSLDGNIWLNCEAVVSDSILMSGKTREVIDSL